MRRRCPVRCSFCYGQGHNKRSCAQYKTKIDALRQSDPGNYTVEVYDRKKKSASVRECSWCGTAGHNVKTCQARQTFRQEAIRVNAAYRREVLAGFTKAGIAPGALLQKQMSYYNNTTNTYETKEVMLLVLDINWNVINFLAKDLSAVDCGGRNRSRLRANVVNHSIVCQIVGAPFQKTSYSESQKELSVGLPFGFGLRNNDANASDYDKANHGYNIVSTSDENLLDHYDLTEWLRGEVGLESLWDTKK